MTDQELKDLLASFAAENAKGFAEMRASMRESQLKSERELASLAQSVRDTRGEVAGVGASQGLVAEEFFYNSLIENYLATKLDA